MSQNRAARVVFVEDNEDHIVLAEAALAREGYINDVMYFNTSETALKYLEDNRATPPDLLFIDLRLKYSSMQGEQLAMWVAGDRNFENTEICVMSDAYVDRETENRFSESKIMFFLKKPLITDQLTSVITKSRRLRRLIVVLEDNIPPENI